MTLYLDCPHNDSPARVLPLLLAMKQPICKHSTQFGESLVNLVPSDEQHLCHKLTYKYKETARVSQPLHSMARNRSSTQQRRTGKELSFWVNPDHARLALFTEACCCFHDLLECVFATRG